MWVGISFAVFTQIVHAFCNEEYTDHGLRHDGAKTYRTGSMNGGTWDCPWHLDNAACADGRFYCTCPADGSRVNFIMGCCYKFPSCGEPCSGHDCNRWKRCASCRTNVNGSWNWRACNSCKPGYVYEDGLCDTDYNECSKGNGGCEQDCTNVYGSYHCSCRSGFRLKDDNHGCQILSCAHPGTISSGSVVATDKSQAWSFHSYARYDCTENHQTLDGPYAIRCNANGQNLFWSEAKPACVDTCAYVSKANRQRCASDSTSRTRCEELGCCYSEDTAIPGSIASTPKCFFDPTKLFVRYGGQKPKTYTPRRSVRERNIASCAHQSLNKDNTNMFLLEHEGRNETHGVDLQLCQPLGGKAEDYEFVKSDTHDLYQYLLVPGDDIRGEQDQQEQMTELHLDSAAITGLPTGLFTLFPKLRSFTSPRLTVHVQESIQAPGDIPGGCMENCYSHCNHLTQIEQNENADVSIYTMHLDLGQLSQILTGRSPDRVYVHAHTVVIRSDVTLRSALYVSSQQMIIDHRHASFINLPTGGATLSTVSRENEKTMDTILERCLRQ